MSSERQPGQTSGARRASRPDLRVRSDAERGIGDLGWEGRFASVILKLFH
jgi:hypothetical protein